jgi:hypothetical protein
MGKILPFAFVALAMVSCSEAEVAADAAPEPTECGAPDQQNLVGKSIDDLAAVSFTSPVTRFINPGDVVTQDFNANRMNIQFGEDGKITRIYCG